MVGEGSKELVMNIIKEVIQIYKMIKSFSNGGINDRHSDSQGHK